MPKMEAASLTLKISLDRIIDTGNIREKEKYGPNEKGEYPPEIIELAQSIKTIGQLQPIVVKQTGEDYEIVAGGRRRAAFQYLKSTGEDFSMIDAKIVTGDKLSIQLVENLQREDLTASEREAAIFQLAQTGIKQHEIAAQLSKSKSFVSINISAYKIRFAGREAGVDLSNVETSTLSELASIPEDMLVGTLRELVRMGGTRASASTLATDYKKYKDTPPPTDPGPAPQPIPTKNDELDPLAKGGEIPAQPKKPERKPLINTRPQDNPPESKNEPKEEPIEAPHRMVDVNIVLTVIYDYIKDMKKTDNDFAKTIAAETAEYLLALILKRLDDA
jgi:ParB/RepB/Spo0J family partition protein